MQRAAAARQGRALFPFRAVPAVLVSVAKFLEPSPQLLPRCWRGAELRGHLFANNPPVLISPLKFLRENCPRQNLQLTEEVLEGGTQAKQGTAPAARGQAEAASTCCSGGGGGVKIRELVPGVSGFEAVVGPAERCPFSGPRLVNWNQEVPVGLGGASQTSSCGSGTATAEGCGASAAVTQGG